MSELYDECVLRLIKQVESLKSHLASALKALEAIRDSPGGGPGRRIASQAIDEIKKVRMIDENESKVR